jgi:hypothetical protein
MKTSRRTAALLLLMASVVVFGFRDSLFFRELFRPEADTTKKVFTNAVNRAAFSSARAATIQRLHLKPEKLGWELSNYESGPAKMLPDQALAEIQRVFQDRRSFRWSAAKSCIPDYGVVIVIPSQNSELRLALCFKCLNFALFDGASRINSENDFDPVASELARIIKPLFPDDAEIQKLQ